MINTYTLLKILKLTCAVLFVLAFNKKLFAQDSLYKININTAKSDVLSLSQLGVECKIIPLEMTISENFIGPTQVCIDDDYIFLTFGSFPLCVVQYSISSGKLIRVIESVEDGSILFDFPLFLTNDAEKNKLFIKCRNTVYFYNYFGELTNTCKMLNYGNLYFFNNEFWGFNVDFTGDGYDIYSLFTTYKCQKSEVRKSITYFKNINCESFEERSIKDPFFLSINDIFYFSMGKDSCIYKFSNNKVVPFCEYSFINGQFNCSDLFLRSPKLLGEEWFFINYRLQGNKFSCFYNFKEKQSYNIPNGIVRDDLYETSGIYARKIKPMKDGYFCFTVPTKKIEYRLKKSTKNSELSLVIMKIKK